MLSGLLDIFQFHDLLDRGSVGSRFPVVRPKAEPNNYYKERSNQGTLECPGTAQAEILFWRLRKDGGIDLPKSFKYIKSRAQPEKFSPRRPLHLNHSCPSALLPGSYGVSCTATYTVMPVFRCTILSRSSRTKRLFHRYLPTCPYSRIEEFRYRQFAK